MSEVVLVFNIGAMLFAGGTLCANLVWIIRHRTNASSIAELIKTMEKLDAQRSSELRRGARGIRL